jgi:hypothetical protein
LRFHGTTTHNALLLSTRLQDDPPAAAQVAQHDQPCSWSAKKAPNAKTSRATSTPKANAPPRSRVPGPQLRCARARLASARTRSVRRRAQIPLLAVERAGGGTLFLDCIENLTQSQQEHLAASLSVTREEGSKERLQRPRLVVATTEGAQQTWAPSLATLLESCRFTIPPLRNDARDVLALAELFLSEMGSSPTARRAC